MAQCVARDVGGKREVAGVHWDYDCYGAPGKISQGRPAMMPNWDKDFEAGRTLLTMNGLPVFEAPLHLEGGSIHSDGQGTLVVTEECLLDPSRNPHLDKEGITNVRTGPSLTCTARSYPKQISDTVCTISAEECDHPLLGAWLEQCFQRDIQC